MIAFLGILLALLVINAMLLIFSVNGDRERRSTPVQKVTPTLHHELASHSTTKSEYTEVV